VHRCKRTLRLNRLCNRKIRNPCCLPISKYKLNEGWLYTVFAASFSVITVLWGIKKHPYVLFIYSISDRFLVQLVAYRAMSFPRCVDAYNQLSADLWFRYIRLPLAASASLLVRLPLKPIRLSTTQLFGSSILFTLHIAIQYSFSCIYLLPKPFLAVV
jgi:hypothetical protein